MEFLFIELMNWGREQGYDWLDLGMAPLSGIEDRSLAPLWNRLAVFVARHGGHFYNFQGLHQYKDKFDPVWEPRYLASPGGLILPAILSDLTQLVSGGLKGALLK
jgi:phosphatidylglycerol lysyltransferase